MSPNTIVAEMLVGSPGFRLSMDEIVSKACDEVHTYLTHKLVSFLLPYPQNRVLNFIYTARSKK